jgi:hypothetical protein
MTSSTVGEIATALQDESFAPNSGSSYQDSSVRRVTTQEYLESVDWSDQSRVTRALRAFERLLLGVRSSRGTSYLSWDQFILAMKRDGHDVTEDGRSFPSARLRAYPKARSPSSGIRQRSRSTLTVFDARWTATRPKR